MRGGRAALIFRAARRSPVSPRKMLCFLLGLMPLAGALRCARMREHVEGSAQMPSSSWQVHAIAPASFGLAWRLSHSRFDVLRVQ